MGWVQWVALAASIANLAGFVRSVILLRRQRAERAQIEVLRILLAEICVQAFGLRHRPIWQAWAATMGSIEVEVRAHHRDAV